MNTPIGGIGNTYGGLEVKQQDGKYYWSISDCFSDSWEEIPESLYHELINFERERKK